jgi:hypothetical protein
LVVRKPAEFPFGAAFNSPEFHVDHIKGMMMEIERPEGYLKRLSIHGVVASASGSDLNTSDS